ncbi:MAG TPA: hypothetical protein VGS57_14930 [Thermoanaerobaculia bacterium]|nr:hypothetical protein [Thermoanaerobaculia bacterium]
MALGGLVVVAAARLLTLPASLWEYDEVLFVRGVERFEPLAYRPHPPGYPLLIGLGKLAAAIVGDPFRGLVALSVIASLVGYLAAVDAFSIAWGGPARLNEPASDGEFSRAGFDFVFVGVAGALLFALSPPMLVYAPLALSDPPALGFVAVALAAAGRWLRRPAAVGPALVCGGAAAAAVGCRPQLVLAVAPMLLVTILLAVRRRGDGRPLTAEVELDAPESVGGAAEATSTTRRGPAAGGAIATTRRGRGEREALPAARRGFATASAAIAAFVVVATAWAVPLLVASGGPRLFVKLLRGQAGLVAANDASLARASLSAARIVGRFVVDPWGPRWAAVVVLGLAAAGGALVARQRRSAALPVLLFGAIDLALALAVMNPPDAARYAMPSMLAVAFLAGGACAAVQRLPSGRVGAPLLLVALSLGFVLYAAPLLRERATTPSPPVQATAWARAHLPDGTLVLYERELESYALELLPRWKRLPADGRLPCATRRPVFLLAEGASALPGAVTFRWNDGPAWRALTRQRLGVVSWTPVAGGRLFEPLAGVYGAEPSARTWLGRGSGVDAWRWLADRASLRVCSEGAPAVDLRLRLPALAPHPDVTVEIVTAGGRRAPLHIARGVTVAVRLPLPPARRVRIDLVASPSFVPAESGLTAGDHRRLAVQLVDLQLVGAPLHH